jgi:hypothetical protein
MFLEYQIVFALDIESFVKMCLGNCMAGLIDRHIFLALAMSFETCSMSARMFLYMSSETCIPLVRMFFCMSSETCLLLVRMLSHV